MSAAPLPSDETARLNELRSYELLDTAPDATLDDLTRLAAQICGTPIAMISLIDEARQWFLSHHGLDATETERDVAFCAHAILDFNHTMIVPDAQQDARFADNPLVSGAPHIRFYAGVPLVSPDGFALGTLCAMDQKPHVLSAEQLDALQILGRQAMRHIEARRQIRTIAHDRMHQTTHQTKGAERFLRNIRLGFVAACLLLIGVSVAVYRSHETVGMDKLDIILFGIGMFAALIIMGWLFLLVMREYQKWRKIEGKMQRDGALRHAILDSAQQAVIAATPDGKITIFNKAAERMLQYREDEMLGRAAIGDIHDPAETAARAAELTVELKRPIAPGFEVFVTAANDGRHEEREWTYIRKDGSRFPALLSVTALRDESRQITGYVGIASDITERKRDMEALRQAKNAAEQGANTKAAFLATMSHEIRTPMNGVIGMTSLLLDTELNAEQREFTDIIRVSGENLLVVINDILDFSKIESGKMDLEHHPFDLQEGVEGSIELLATLAQEKRLDLLYLIDTDVPRWIFGDLPRLRQILVNLISNAIKFTPHGDVLVSVRRLPPTTANTPALKLNEPCVLEFCVKDSGIGIPADKIGSLFTAFTQVDSSTSRKFGGTGLGLAISKRLVEAMGGTMRVESREAVDGISGETSFYFTVPSKVAPGTSSSELISTAATHGKRVLLVDDNETNLRILTSQIERWGIQAHSANTPQAALKLIESGEHYDLLITDMHMPGMNGVELMRRVRHLKSSMPSILLSSVSMRHSRDAALFAATLMKPIRQSALLDAVMHALHAYEAVTQSYVRRASEFDISLATRLPLRILLAEDNEVNQKLALRMLKAFGYKADIAANGLEAVQAVRRQTYDLVLMDIQMPEMDGLDATRIIIDTVAKAYRPCIIGMSANALREDVDIALAVGMKDYLTKPIAPTTLRTILETWGGLPRQQQPGNSQTSNPTTSTKLINTDHLMNAETPSNSKAANHIASNNVLDHEQIDSISEVDADGSFLKGMVDSFSVRCPALIAKIDHALTQRDAELVASTGHELRGMSGILGAMYLMQAAAALENKGKAGDFDDTGRLLTELRHEAERARVALQAHSAAVILAATQNKSGTA